MSKSFLHVGTIVGVVGIKGQLKVKTYLTDLTIIDKIGMVMIEGFQKKRKISFIREIRGNAVIMLEKIINRNQAEELVGKKLFLNKNQLPELGKGEYYLQDLLGFVVKNLAGKRLGLVNNIKNFGASDLIEIYNKNTKSYYLPINNENIIKVNLKSKTIIADPLRGIVPNK